MAARFGEMLLERRRQRGLSIQQVANVIKIRPQIIEYFECENFAAMPPRGYAQGMIASYARYLGLNPREVVGAYFDSLHAFEQQAAGTGIGRYHESVADASPRSANATGRFLMVNSGPASSRFATRPPQAGYVSESTSPHEPMAAQRLRPAPRGGRPVGAGRSGDMRGPADRSRRSGAGAAGRRQMESARGGYRGADRRGGARRPAGSGAPGRRPSRQTPAPLAFDPLLLIGGAIGLIVIVIVLTVLVMRGCAPAASPAQGSVQADASTSSKDTSNDSASDDSSDDSGDDAATDDAAAADTTSSDGSATGDAADSEPTETVVKVSISGKGTVAWLEVKLDGKSVLASQEVGPFEQEFTVTQQIEITTDKPSDVTVTKNGEKVRYDTKVSGVGKVTITAPQQTDSADTAADQSGDAASTDTSDAGGQTTAQQ